MSWHHPDLYFFLCLLAGLAAFLAIIYECIQKFCRRNPVYLKKAKPLDGLRRDRQGGAADAQSACEFRTVFNMTSQASKEADRKVDAASGMQPLGGNASCGGGVAAS
jgi:hypothetical protein